MQEPELEQNKKELAPITLDWVMGFIEGEGCFSTWVGHNKGYRHVRCEIIIGQKERYILERINEFMGGWGKIHVQKSGSGTSKKKKKYECYVLKFHYHEKQKIFVKTIKNQFRSITKYQQFKRYYEALIKTKEANNTLENWWTQRENQIVLENAEKPNAEIRLILLENGYNRTRKAIRTRKTLLKYRKPKYLKNPKNKFTSQLTLA